MLISRPLVHAAFSTDADGVITSWGDGCENLFGYSPSDILGTSIKHLLSERARQAWEERWPSLPRQAEALELQFQRPGGATFVTTLTLAPQVDRGGEFLGCVAFAEVDADRDLPERMLVGKTPLDAIVNVFAGTFYVLNRASRFVLWNRTLERVAQMSQHELETANALDMFRESDHPMLLERIRRVFENGEEFMIELDYLGKNGKATPYLMCGTRIVCNGTAYLCGMGLDISRRREQEEQLRLRDRALHAAGNGIVITRCCGKDNPIVYVNPAFVRITGYSEQEVLGRDSRFMAAPGLDETARNELREAITHRREVTVVMRNLRKDGELFWNELAITPVLDEHGTTTHFIGVINNVTAQMHRTAHLEHEVNHDPLTGLANRNLMWDRLEQALHMAQRNKTLVATVLIDLDGFKLINDSLGHEAGDEVLVVVARRLQAAVRDSDTVARMSGDEFVLVLANQPSLRYTLRMVERVRHAISKPVVFDRTDIPVAASMGVSVFPHDGASAFDLVRAADVAMYHAKSTGKNAMHFYSEDMRSSTEAKRQFEFSMRQGLDNDEFFMLFQPLLNLRSKRITGVEALLRWRHPEQGVLLPTAFLPEAEENGMVVPIGKRAFEQVCILLRVLKNGGRHDLTVFMNCAFREFSQPNYISQIGAALAECGVSPACLELDLKEDELLRNTHLSRGMTSQMRDLGLKVAVDDFAGGVSSLDFLQKLAPDHIKISRAVVSEICPESRSGPMAKTLIDIGHNLGIAVVGEGVETLAQLDFLQVNGCDEMQGNYFSEPIDLAALQELLAAETQGLA